MTLTLRSAPICAGDCATKLLAAEAMDVAAEALSGSAEGIVSVALTCTLADVSSSVRMQTGAMQLSVALSESLRESRAVWSNEARSPATVRPMCTTVAFTSRTASPSATGANGEGGGASGDGGGDGGEGGVGGTDGVGGGASGDGGAGGGDGDRGADDLHDLEIVDEELLTASRRTELEMRSISS